MRAPPPPRHSVAFILTQFRSALEEREYVNKRAEVAHLVEEASVVVGRLDQCHANIKELQVAFRQMQQRLVGCGTTLPVSLHPPPSRAPVVV